MSKEEKFQKWGGPCADPEYIKEAVDQCLSRLGIDTIDLLYLHRMDQKTPIEDSMTCLKSLVEQKKIKYLGLSEYTPEVVRKAHAIHPITALLARDLETDIVPLCKELNIALVCYSPLGRGMLANAFQKRSDIPQDWRTAPPDSPFGTCGRMTEENFDKNLNLINEILSPIIKELSSSDGDRGSTVTYGQLSKLAWLMKKAKSEQCVICPNPATTKAERVRENMKAREIEKQLTDDMMKKLDEGFKFEKI